MILASACDQAAELAISAVEALRGVDAIEGSDLYTHSLNSAASALADAAPPALVAAALLHDIAHGFDPEEECDAVHAELAADWLSRLFGPAVTEPVRLHVAAKRYLVARDPTEHPLSPGSVLSLAKQGGPMREADCRAFESSPYFLDAILLRQYDDAPPCDRPLSADAFRECLTLAASDTSRRPDQPDPRSIVYVAMCGDIVHGGHLNILDRAAALGRVVVGVLTDPAIAAFKRVPFLDFDHRSRVIRALRQVDAVVAQTTLDYRPNLRRFRPRYVVHGDDWREGVQQETRRQVLTEIARWGGELVEPPYTMGISSTGIQERVKAVPPSPLERCSAFARAMRVKPMVRVIDAHSGLSALIGERARVETPSGAREFDALWSGSLTTAALKARSDNGVVDFSARTAVLADILQVSRKPVLFDAEHGGEDDELRAITNTLERHGVSGIVIEDKAGPKRNSFDPGGGARLADLDLARHRIRILAEARNIPQHLIFARLEGLTLGAGLEETVDRALALEAAGADVMLPHSRAEDPGQVIAFARSYREAGGQLPLAAIPTLYSTVDESELMSAGFSIVIYANQLLRAAIDPMVRCALDLLEHQSAGPLEDRMAPVQRLIKIEALAVVRSNRDQRAG